MVAWANQLKLHFGIYFTVVVKNRKKEGGRCGQNSYRVSIKPDSARSRRHHVVPQSYGPFFVGVNRKVFSQDLKPWFLFRRRRRQIRYASKMSSDILQTRT